eukprot:m.346567 g.346567  ORF g.346567 m.346567 type:complete len:55 (-) comp16143_c0_seq9:454-618(-)
MYIKQFNCVVVVMSCLDGCMAVGASRHLIQQYNKVGAFNLPFLNLLMNIQGCRR